MKKLVTLLVLTFCSFAHSTEFDNILKLHASITPNAGSFVATSNKSRGRLLKTNNVFTADRISVFSESFMTENTLRDKHVADYLAGGENRPFPRIDIIELRGENNKAKAKIIINNITKEIEINFLEKDNYVEAEFEINTSDFNLSPASFLGVKVSNKVKVTSKYFWESK